MARLLLAGLSVAWCASHAIAGGGSPPTCPEGVVVTLWPPDHEVHLVDLETVAGVTDPDGGEVHILITSITQDESVNGMGDGNTSCDGMGVGLATARIRAERSGNGDGRVYHINYMASGVDGECEGTVLVWVPHSQNGDPPVDGGQDFDASRCFRPSDLDGSGGVDTEDLALVLSHWGEAEWSDGDANLDGIVDAADLAMILTDWDA